MWLNLARYADAKGYEKDMERGELQTVSRITQAFGGHAY